MAARRATGTPKSDPVTVEAAAKSGDRRRVLEALRDKLAAAVDEASPMVVAQIAGRLQAVVQELDELPVAAEVSKSDELRARRAAGRGATSAPTSLSAAGVEHGAARG